MRRRDARTLRDNAPAFCSHAMRASNPSGFYRLCDDLTFGYIRYVRGSELLTNRRDHRLSRCTAWFLGGEQMDIAGMFHRKGTTGMRAAHVWRAMCAGA